MDPAFGQLEFSDPTCMYGKVSLHIYFLFRPGICLPLCLEVSDLGDKLWFLRVSALVQAPQDPTLLPFLSSSCLSLSPPTCYNCIAFISSSSLLGGGGLDHTSGNTVLDLENRDMLLGEKQLAAWVLRKSKRQSSCVNVIVLLIPWFPHCIIH